MKLTDIILENWTPEKSTFNDKTRESNLTGKADNIKDFFKAINRLPDTIKSIKVPINSSSFKTSSDYKKIEPVQGWKEEVKKTILDVVDQHKDKNEVVDSFELSTYGFDAKPTDDFYIQLRTKQSEKFGKDMAAGKYGPLD